MPNGSPAPALVPALRFSTEGVRPAERFAAYHAATAGVFALDPLGGTAPPDFPAEMETYALGPFVLRRLRDGGVRYRREERRARRDGLDHWVVSTFRRGAARGVCEGETYEVPPGAPVFLGLQQPLDSERGASDLVSLFLPRDAMPELNAPLDALAGGAVDAPLARLLASHMLTLAEVAGQLTVAEAARAAEATAAVLRAAVAGLDRLDAPARARVAMTERARLLAVIRRDIGSVRLGPDRLARIAGMSRTRLYDVFEPEGGVASAIRRERLRAIRRALADPADGRGVAEIADAFGFPDAAVFSRAFRREFGAAAREWRDHAAAGLDRSAPRTADAAPPRDMGEMLRRLGRG